MHNRDEVAVNKTISQGSLTDSSDDYSTPIEKYNNSKFTMCVK
jgi:hypothetical protein